MNLAKASRLALFTLGGMAIGGPLGWVAGPAMGGALGSAMGLSGAAATSVVSQPSAAVLSPLAASGWLGGWPLSASWAVLLGVHWGTTSLANTCRT